MREPFILKPHIARFIKIYNTSDKEVPQELFSAAGEKPVLDGFPLPLPSKKSDYTLCVKHGGITWLGASTGLTRYDPNAEYDYDKIMYFSADRDLRDNCVKAILPDDDGVWVLTQTGASRIDLKPISAEEKADMLRDEAMKIVYRQGYISQKHLNIPGDISSYRDYDCSDNDGGFTAGFCMGEMMHYAVLKKEKGADHPDTKKARENAMKTLEACLVLMDITGRGNGFIARTMITSDCPVPDDGLFLRRQGDKAIVAETTSSKKKKLAGVEVDASYPVNPRLARVYRDLGYTEDDIIYKSDTSSDETTLHVLNCWYAHEIFGEEDEELDAIVKDFVSRFVDFVIDNGYEFIDFTGKPTTWAKWSEKYFASPFGWADGCLNSVQMLMYIKIANAICGETEKRKNAYEDLLAKGYPDLAERHYTRAMTCALVDNVDVVEDIMYGDHLLATLACFGFLLTEDDEELREKIIKGWLSWRDTSITREHHPIYDFPFAVVCPDKKINMEKAAEWFYRFNTSTLASGVSLTSRNDVAVKTHIGSYKETSFLLPPDEKFISKQDRNPLEYKNEDSGGMNTVESCEQYHFPYWMGRYYGLIKEEK